MSAQELARNSSDYLMDEIWRMTRRFQDHRHISESTRIQYAAYLCKLWDALYIQQCAAMKTSSELAAIDPTNQEPVNVAA